MDHAQFRNRLEQAFAAVPYPGDDNLTGCDCPDCANLNAYFRGKSWRGHTVLDLRSHCDALYRFTVAALLYYLPAFVLAELEDSVTADVISDGLISVFVPFHDSKAVTLARTLTPDQRAVMIEFVEYLLEVEGDDFAQRMSQALRTIRAAATA